MTHCRFVFCPSDESCEEKIKSTHLPSHYCSMSVTFTGFITSCRFLCSSVHRSVTQTSIWSGLVLICEMCVSLFPESLDSTSIGWCFSLCVCRVWRTHFTRWCERFVSTRWGSWTRRTRADRTAWAAAASCRDPGAKTPRLTWHRKHTDRMNDITHWKPVKINCKSSLTITDLLRNASWKTSTCEREILYLCIY